MRGSSKRVRVAMVYLSWVLKFLAYCASVGLGVIGNTADHILLHAVLMLLVCSLR